MIDDGVVIFQQVIDEPGGEQGGTQNAGQQGQNAAPFHLRDGGEYIPAFANDVGNYILHIGADGTDTGGHGLIQADEQQDGGRGETGQHQAQAPDDAAEEIPPAVGGDGGAGGGEFEQAQQGKYDDEADTEYDAVILGAAFQAGFPPEGGNGAHDQTEEEAGGHGGIFTEGQFHQLGQRHKADGPAQQDGDEQLIILFQRLYGMGKQRHHGLIDAKEYAQHAAADAGHDGANAYQRPMQHPQKPLADSHLIIVHFSISHNVLLFGMIPSHHNILGGFCQVIPVKSKGFPCL